MKENNHSFCCGRESPPSFAIAARDLPWARCLLVREEVEKKRMTNSYKVFTSIAANAFLGTKAKPKLFSQSNILLSRSFSMQDFLKNKFFSPFQKAAPQKKSG